MWKWVQCYLSGRHEFGVWCEPGTIFLRCMHCGKRSSGWAVVPKAQTLTTSPSAVLPSARRAGRVVPFGRVAVR